MKDGEQIIDCGLIYEFKLDGPCSDCCFMLDTENECIAPFFFRILVKVLGLM